MLDDKKGYSQNEPRKARRATTDETERLKGVVRTMAELGILGPLLPELAPVVEDTAGQRNERCAG